MKLTQNAHPDKHGCSGYGIGFDARSQFFYHIASGLKMLFLVYTIVCRCMLIIEKNILVFVGAKYSVSITKSRKETCLSVHYNATNNFLYVNSVKIQRFKAKDSEIKPYSLCLENISKYFTVDNMKNKKHWIEWKVIRLSC